MSIIDCATGKTRDHTAEELAEIEKTQEASTETVRDLKAEAAALIDEIAANGALDTAQVLAAKALLGL